MSVNEKMFTKNIQQCHLAGNSIMNTLPYQFMTEGGRCQQTAVIGLLLSMANRAAPILPARGNYIRLRDIICMRNELLLYRAMVVESAEKVPSPHEQIYIEA